MGLLSLRASALICSILAATPALAQVATLSGFKPLSWPVPRVGVRELDPRLAAEMPTAAARFVGTLINKGQLLLSTNANSLVSMNAGSGDVTWQTSFKVDIKGPLSCDGEKVYVSLVDGGLAALDVHTGSILWQVGLDSHLPRQIAFAEGFIFAFTATQKLYKLEKASGKTEWIYDAGYQDGLLIHKGPAPLLLNDRVLLGLASGTLLAVSASSGVRLWEYSPEFSSSRFKDVVGAIHKTAADEIVLTSYDGRVEAIRLVGATPARLWLQNFATLTTSELRADQLFVACFNGDVFSLNPSSGERLWKFSTGEAVSSLALDDADQSLTVVGTSGLSIGCLQKTAPLSGLIRSAEDP